VLYTENFGATCGFSTCSHGISLSPDDKEVAVVDAAHKAVQFWTFTGSPKASRRRLWPPSRSTVWKAQREAARMTAP